MTKHKKKTKKHASSSVEAVVPAADTDDQPRSPSPDVATVPSSKVQADASPEAIDNTTEEVIAEPSIESVVQSSTEMVADESALNNNYNDPSYNDQQVPDLLSGLLKKQAEKAPKTWEEFCRASFDIYHRIRTWKLEQGAILGNLAWRQDELTEFAKDYIELIELYLSNKVEEDERAETLKKHLPAAILCVKMYIENAGTICLGQLRDWLADSENLDAPPVELGVANRLGWPFIQMHILQGRFGFAIDELEMYVATEICTNKKALSQLIDILRAIPELPYTQEETTAWVTKQSEWRELVYAFWNEGLDDAEDRDAAGLETTVMMLMGDLDGLDMTFCDYWMGSLIFAEVHDSEWTSLLVGMGSNESSQEKMYCDIWLKDLDGFFGALDMEGDLWMSVHLGYLMVLADQLPGGLSIAPEPTNEERITEPICYQYRAYADQLVLEFNMLKEAMEYNMACPVNANAWNKQLLTRHGITSLGEKALKSIALFCRNNQLIFVDQFIYTTLGDRLFEQKKYLECVSPYAYAENSTALDMIAKILLDQYLKDGSLDQVVTDKEYTLALETSPAYSFLYNYKILRDFIQAEQLDQAYDKLWMLMGSLGFVNAEYSLVLLIDAFDVYLSAKAATRTDTLQLLHQLDIAVKDEAWPSFATNYYACHHNGKELAPDLIAEKLKQRFIYYLMQLA